MLCLAAYSISKPDRLFDLFRQVLLCAVPFNKSGIEAHLVLENLPSGVLMSHAFVMLAKYELHDHRIITRVFLQML